MEDGRIYDGHTYIFGMDSDTEPSAISSETAWRAVNRVFRGGLNVTRPGFHHKHFEVFDSIKEKEPILKYGNFQGWAPYIARRPNRVDGIVIAVAGRIFFVSLVNEKFQVALIFEGNDPKLTHTWFKQVEEWMYIQNGSDRPIFWDGQLPSTARRSDPDIFEMPIGTIMEYAHGRIFLSNAFDQIAASDIIYGDNLTSTAAVQKFTENLYWAEGGYFGQPSNLGRITGMAVVPRLDQTINGQGELVILSEEGASAIDVSVPRHQWKDSKIQTVTMAGRGCVAPESVKVVNNDVWFRSDDGVASYQLSRMELKNRLSLTKVSRAVNWWLSKDTIWLQRYTSCLYFDNRFFTTTYPVIDQAKDAAHGSHRYFNGMVVLDLDQASGVQGDQESNWDGLWTGIRPTGLLKLGKRAFAFSYDSDGENRIYEITKDRANDLHRDERINIKSFYMTKRFDFSGTQKTNIFETKRLIGGEINISDIHAVITISVDFRPDNVICWASAMDMKEFGSDFTGEWIFSNPRFKNFQFGTPVNYCVPGLDTPINQGRKFQFRVNMAGHVRVDEMRVAIPSSANPQSAAPDCRPNNVKISLDCGMRDDFAYDICSEYNIIIENREEPTSEPLVNEEPEPVVDVSRESAIIVTSRARI